MLLMMSIVTNNAKSQEFDGTSEKTVVLYSLSDCCEGAAYEAAELAFERELSALGISYFKYSGRGTDDDYSPSLLEPFAKHSGNVAAILFYKRRRVKRVGVYIAIFEQSGEQPEIEHFSFETESGKGADAEVTLKAVEAVHAAFFDRPIDPSALSAAEHVSKSDSRKTSDEADSKSKSDDTESTEADSSKERAVDVSSSSDDSPLDSDTPKDGDLKRWGVSIGIASLWSPGGVDPMLGVDIAAEGAPFSWLILEVSGLISFFSQPFDIRGNDVKLGVVLVRGAALWNILPDKRVRPLVGIIGGGVFVRADGNSAVTEKVTGRVAYVGGDVRLNIELLSMLAVRLGGRVGVLLPEVNVGAAREVGSGEELRIIPLRGGVQFGQPLIEGYLGLMLRF
jgi:hypothetical protein